MSTLRIRLNTFKSKPFFNWLSSVNADDMFTGYAKIVNDFFSRTEKVNNRSGKIYAQGKPNNEGKVYLIGAGVGDAELITLKAHRILQSADVIMVDWLVNPDIYQYFPKNAKQEFVGKKCGKHSKKQSDICQQMLKHAQQGKTVVRLKGGDPSIFGRIAEETAVLTKHNIEFAIVPGITAALGCAAYSGIPLTHRDCAQSVRFVTASLKDENQQANWQAIANEKDTLVFYMGLNRVTQIAEKLVQYGMSENTPIAIVDQGTLPTQQVCCSTLNRIEQDMRFYDLAGPALIIVGEVVNKREQINLSLLQQSALALYASN